MDIRNLVVLSIDELLPHMVSIQTKPAICKRFNVNTWIRLEKDPHGSFEGRVSSSWISNEAAKAVRYLCSVSACSGGSWSYFANFGVFDDYIKISLKTSIGILQYKHEFEFCVFEFCNPRFPDNFIEFVKQAATNANLCFELAQRRSRARWNRLERLRKGRNADS